MSHTVGGGGGVTLFKSGMFINLNGVWLLFEFFIDVTRKLLGLQTYVLMFCREQYM